MKRFTVSDENAMMNEAYDSRRKELKQKMKKWMTICLMAAVSAMLLAGCGTKDNTATTAVETTAKAEDTKETETETAEETTQAAAGETAALEAADDNSGLDLTAAAGKHHVEITVKDYGTIDVELDGDAAPITVANFLDLAGNGFYDGLTFHRIISGFMIQGGDPLGTGMGGSEREIKGEFASNGVENSLSHTRGAISMARAQRKDSASSQFFIVHEDSTFLDGEYACFGYVTDGMDVVDAICEDTKVEDNNGTVAKENQPVIESIKVID